MWRADFASFRQNEWLFAAVLGSFSKCHRLFSITYWLRSYYFCIVLARLGTFETGSLLCPSLFRGATLPLGRVPGKAHYLGSTCAFDTQSWVRFGFVLKTLPVFSITYWLRSYYFVFLSESCLPDRSPGSGIGKLTSREVREVPAVSPSCDPKNGVDGWLPNSSTL